MTHFPSTQISTRFVSLFLLIPSPASTWAVGGASYPPSRWRHSGQKRVLALRELVVLEISARRRSCQSFPREGKSPFSQRETRIYPHTLKIFQVSSQRNIACFSWSGGHGVRDSRQDLRRKPRWQPVLRRGSVSPLCSACAAASWRKGKVCDGATPTWNVTGRFLVGSPFSHSPPFYYCASVGFFLNRSHRNHGARLKLEPTARATRSGVRMGGKSFSESDQLGWKPQRRWEREREIPVKVKSSVSLRDSDSFSLLSQSSGKVVVKLAQRGRTKTPTVWNEDELKWWIKAL